MNLRKKVFFILVALTATSAWAQTDPIGSISYNSDISAYEINTADNLKDLAVFVNGSGTYSTGGDSETTPHNCSGLVFKMTDDISIDYTTAWNLTSSDEDNFTAIGTGSNSFAGTFDGQNHTISGIRIYSNSNSYQGLFGNNSGTVRNVTIANTRITGNSYLGGIAGKNTGTIDSCKVMNDVMIHTAATSGIDYLGGIAGISTSGTISHCVSSVQITEDSEVTSSAHYGGITGRGQGLSNNIAYGVNISANNLNYKAAIVGEMSANNLTYNYYINCSLISTDPNNSYTLKSDIGRAWSTGGIYHEDVTTNYGAVAVWSVTLADEYVSVATTAPAITFNETNYYKTGSTFTLSHDDRVAQGYAFNTYSVTKDGTDPVQNVTVNPSYNPIGYYFDLPDNHVTVKAIYNIQLTGSGTQQDPYIIRDINHLNYLATQVNSGNDYNGKYFKLGADIAYPHTSEWNNASSRENNYTPIGLKDGDNNARHFRGIFDGDNHIVSGIRIFKGGVGGPDEKMGMFGYVDGGTVKNIILADTRITGYNDVGGIVGHLMGDGKVQSCHVLDDVLIRAENASASYHGGVVGATNYGSNCVIDSCSSSAKIAGPGRNCFGGIVGGGGGYVRNNLVIGASIDSTTNTGSSGTTLYFGAISGDHDWDNLSEKYQNNYYWNCKIGGSNINRARGSIGANISTNDGATPCFFITCGENVSTGAGSSTFTIPAHGNVPAKTYVFSVDQRYVNVSYDAPHDHDALEAVLTYTYISSITGNPVTADVTEDRTFRMPYADITIMFKHYNLLNAIEPGKWYAISSPMHDEDQNYSGVETYFYSESIANSTNLATGTYDMFRYDEPTMTWENQKASTGIAEGFSTLEVGRGYIYRIGGTSSATLQYRGVENSGDIYSIVYNSSGGNIRPLDKNGGTKSANDILYGFNLIGNPYPHQIYYGTHIPTTNLDANYYYSLDPNGCWHVRTSSEPIGTCEAILVYASATGPLVFSDNANPPAQNSGKTLMFTVSDGTNEDVAYAVLGTANEKGMPKIAHMEAGLPSLSIRMGGNRYAMAAIDAETTELPLYFSGKTGKYTISVEAMENAGYLHLIDLQTGNDIDLLLQPTYTFTQSSNNTSAQGDRFLVKFSNSQLPTSNSLFAYQIGDQTIITGTGTLQVFDVMGRQLLSTEVDSSPFSLHRSQFPATGVYILRLDGQTQKIVIK